MLAEKLLKWYDVSSRSLPWRVPYGLGEGVDPWHVWLSETMLQQTTVAVVTERFQRCLARFPDLESFANAPLHEVLHEWQGLGYYARARNLHRAARIVVSEHGGKLPRNIAQLGKLPGIGEYTKNAIAAFAFDQQVAVLDGNVERVVSRLWKIDTPLPSARKLFKQKLQEHVPRKRAGDFGQAMIELGALCCRPRNPHCALCPLREVLRREAALAGFAKQTSQKNASA